MQNQHADLTALKKKVAMHAGPYMFCFYEHVLWDVSVGLQESWESMGAARRPCCGAWSKSCPASGVRSTSSHAAWACQVCKQLPKQLRLKWRICDDVQAQGVVVGFFSQHQAGSRVFVEGCRATTGREQKALRFRAASATGKQEMRKLSSPACPVRNASSKADSLPSDSTALEALCESSLAPHGCCQRPPRRCSKCSETSKITGPHLKPILRCR